MHIAFNFHYFHNNGLFVRVLKEIRKRSSLPVTLFERDGYYRIEATGDQRELERLAELVSQLTPKSLFLDNVSVKEIPGREDESDFYETNHPYAIPCCPECQEKIIQTLNPFIDCDICGFSETKITRDELCSFVGIEAVKPEEVFMELVQQLKREGTAIVPTENGSRCFSLLQHSQDSKNGILICDPSTVSTSWMITQGEFDTLMMIEKPTVRMKPKLRFRAEKNLQKSFYPVFFPDDRITVAFAAALMHDGIESVYCDRFPSLRTVSALEHHVIVHPGRDMLPWRHSISLDQRSSCNFDEYYASGDKNGVTVDEKASAIMEPYIRFVSNEEAFEQSGLMYFEPGHAVLRSIVLEHNLQGKSLCGVYLSRNHASQICSFSSKIGYTPMALFSEEVAFHPKGILDSIALMDEAGERLVANYKNAYPSLVETIEKVEFTGLENASMLVRLWAVAAVVIGFSEGEDMHEACEQLEATALEFSGKSGPRIDYKVIKTETGYRIDPRLAIRSAMSFKLAGVDEYLLSFGFIDSLADFIAQQAELADANIAIEGVGISGSLFENRQLLMRTINAFSKNYPLYYNRRLGMDGPNVAIGAITLGSE